LFLSRACPVFPTGKSKKDAGNKGLSGFPSKGTILLKSGSFEF
jgi:hypothetical protein